MLRLNSISRDVLEARDIRKDGDNSVSLKVNSADGTTKNKEITRKEIVTTGRLVACEKFGAMVNRNPMQIEKYNSKLKDMNCDYATLAQKHKEKKLLYCAAKVAKMYDKEVPTTFDDFKANCNSYVGDPIFMKMLSSIDEDILRPIFFNLVDAVAAGLNEITYIPMGSTKEIRIQSNDVFLYEDSAIGSLSSTPNNYLYAKTITLNPKPYTAKAKIKWFADYVNGDPGDYYRAIVLGAYNKMYAIVISQLKAATTNKKYIPSGLTAETYTTDNWTKITDLVAAANGMTDVRSLMAIGTRSALSKVIPTDGTGAAILGMQYGLGETWFRNGFLPNAGGVDLFPVMPAIVPGTQNDTLDTIDTGDNIYIVAKGGEGYKPIYTAVYENSPFTLTTTPDPVGGAMGTQDATINISCAAYWDTKPVFASKVGVITTTT